MGDCISTINLLDVDTGNQFDMCPREGLRNEGVQCKNRNPALLFFMKKIFLPPIEFLLEHFLLCVITINSSGNTI